MRARWATWMAFGALAVGIVACSTAPEEQAEEQPEAQAEERDYYDIVVELTETFGADEAATVSVAEARIPERMAERLDGNGDGTIERGEFWAFQEKGAKRPYSGPADRSKISMERPGGFPMNVDPEIVAADEAGLGDDDMVMGVVIAGEARAYPVNYMNGPLNEVVNDTLGGAKIAPSW